jgi:DnaJ-class molecular chaperone
MEDQNHFERLEVHWSARDDDIEKGYERLRHKWEGAGGGIELPPRHDKMRQDVLAALKESYTLLRDTSQRQRYRGEVYEAQQISFSADIFFRQGEMLMIKKKWREVIDNCTRAAELRPDIRKYANAAKAARAKMNE